jgi:hypothetical protein
VKGDREATGDRKTTFSNASRGVREFVNLDEFQMF